MNTANHNLNSKPIGFFDSGVGGLSVYARFKDILPSENTLYFGDTIHLPYGNKSKNELISFARSILNFYKTKDVKAVVIACNTSSAQAYETVKDEYEFKIYPIIQPCTQIIASGGAKRIGVFATEATVKSGVYTKELLKHNHTLLIKEIACPNWVNIVESGKYKNDASADDIKQHLTEMSEFRPEKIILGCTHYPYLMNILSKFADKELFIDPAEIFVKYIKEDLKKSQLLNTNGIKGDEEIFVSSCPESFKEHSKIFYNVKNVTLCKI